MDLKETFSHLIKLEEYVQGLGCETRLIMARDVLVDDRVRLKCRLNGCGHYNQNLMCPPYQPSLTEVRRLLGRYTFAMLLRLSRPAPADSLAPVFYQLALQLNDIVVKSEREAFTAGFCYACGLGAGECKVCDKCVLGEGEERCRFPGQARPSMEALGIDVLKTCRLAGLSADFVPGQLTLVGLLLIN